MHLRYTLSLNDMLTFQAYCDKHIPQAKNGRFILRVGFPLIAIAFSLILTVNNPGLFTIAMFIIVIALLFGSFFPLFSKYFIVRRFRKTHQGDSSEEFTFTVDEKGIASGSSKGKTDLYWNTIRDVVETDTLFLFFYTPLCAVIVPRSALEDHRSTDEFIQLVQQYHAHPITQVSR